MDPLCLLTWSATFLPLGEVLEAIGRPALCLLVLLYMPGQLGGDVGDEVAGGPQTVVVPSHSELAVLRRRSKSISRKPATDRVSKEVRALEVN